MTKEQFEHEMMQLKIVYGVNKYPEIRTDILWEKFYRIPYNSFKKTVSLLIANETYAPMLNHFEKLLNSELLEIQSREIEALQEELGFCSACENTGTELFVSKENYAFKYAFRCTCPRPEALNLSRSIPEQFSGMSKDFIPLRNVIGTSNEVYPISVEGMTTPYDLIKLHNVKQAKSKERD